MKITLGKYTLIHLGLTAAACGVLFGLRALSGPLNPLWVDLASAATASALVWAAFALTNRGLAQKAAGFTRAITAGMMLKLLVTLAFVALVALTVDGLHKMAFALTYFLAFFSFTSFEVFALMNNLRENSDKDSQNRAK